MNRNTFLNYIDYILEHFSSFKKDIEDSNFKQIPDYFNTEHQSQTQEEYLTNFISFIHRYLEKYSAAEFYDLCVELVTYLEFFKQNCSDLHLRQKVQMTLSIIREDLFPLSEKLIVIESKRFLNFLCLFEPSNTNKKLSTLSNLFSFGLKDYDYLIGYDLCHDQFDQLSFFNPDPKEDLENLIGYRRVLFQEKITQELSKNYASKKENMEQVFTDLIPFLDETKRQFLEEEVDRLRVRKERKLQKTEYTYFASIQ